MKHSAYVAVLCLTFALTACNKKATQSGQTVTLTGRVVLAPVSGAAVYVTEYGQKRGDKPSAVTDATGQFSVQVAPGRSYEVWAAGGTGKFKDEATNVEQPIPEGGIRTLVTPTGQTRAVVSAATDLAVRVLEERKESAQDFPRAIALVAKTIGAPVGVDLTAMPAADTKEASARDLAVLMVAAQMSELSRLQNMNAVALNQALARDLANDGLLNGNAPGAIPNVAAAIEAARNEAQKEFPPIFSLPVCASTMTPIPSATTDAARAAVGQQPDGGLSDEERARRLGVIQKIDAAVQAANLQGMTPAIREGLEAGLQAGWGKGLDPDQDPLNRKGMVRFGLGRDVPKVDMRDTSPLAQRALRWHADAFLGLNPEGEAPAQFNCGEDEPCFNECPFGPRWPDARPNVIACIIRLPVCVPNPPPGVNPCVLKLTITKNADGSCSIDIDFRRDGCFDSSTRLLLADKTTRAIPQIKAGDLLWNPVRAKAVRVKKVISGPEWEKMYVFKTLSGKLTVTRLHPMWTSRGIIAAEDVRLTDELVHDGGRPARILEITRGPVPVDRVYNVELDVSSMDPKDRMIVADGIVTGDHAVQRELARKKAPSTP